jgi:curli biogenesis system outer membrane secretion channel CsgG
LNTFRLSWPLLALPFLAVAATPGQTVPAGSKIYIEAADGFDTYLTAALQKKKVPVSVVDNKEHADYQLSGVSDHQKAGWVKGVVFGQIHSDEQASIKLVNIKTGEVVFAYAVNKKNSLHGRQTAAEACAKHMREVVAAR